MAGRKLGTAKTGGRKAGTPNKATVEIREYAQQYSLEAVDRLVRIMRSSQNEGACIAAIKEILDRAHGKSTQPLHHEGGIRIPHEETLKIVAARIEAAEAQIKAEDERFALMERKRLPLRAEGGSMAAGQPSCSPISIPSRCASSPISRKADDERPRDAAGNYRRDLEPIE
jgi:DNA-binding transcriptional MerR regulator